MKIYRKTPLATMLLGALSATLPVMSNAQTANAKSTPTPDSDQIVVTAQKVAQPTFKVGASLSAIGADDIREKGVTDAKSLTDLMPNTQISQAGNSSVVVNIRGIENTNTTGLGEPAAAFHIDGVYLARMSGAGSAFYDIDRVEVLRGPQGTLYGRNANAGVVNVITKAPSDKREGAVSLELGNLGQQRLDGMFNLPVNDALSVRAAFSTNRRDGFSETKTATNGFTENQDSIHTDSMRLQARLKLSSETSLNLSYDESTNKTTGPNYYNLTTGGIPTKLVDPNLLIQGRFNDKMSGYKAELKTDLGFANLNYIYGNRTTKNHEDYNTGPLLLLTKFTSEQESHEFRLSSNDAKSPLQWVTGYYKFKETGKSGQLDGNFPFDAFGSGKTAPFGPSQCGGFTACWPGLQYIDRLITSDSEAYFGQATYSLNETTRVIAGARSTSDKKVRDYGTQTFAFNGMNYGASGNGVSTLYGDASWKSNTYKLAFEKDLSPTQMVYASASTGFKSGGFNDGDTRVNPSLIYQPETIKAFETGLNGKFFDNALQVTSSIFHYDYDNMQKSGVVNGSMLTANTGTSTVDGAELSARYRLSKAGRIDASLGLLRAKYTKYTTPDGTNYAGLNLDKAPSLSLNVGYAHNWNLESGARLTGYFGTKYSSSYVTTDTGDVKVAPTQFTQQAFTKSNVSLTYATSDDTMDIQFYVKNIENKSQLLGSVAFFGANYGYMSEPRTIGVRSTFRF